MNPSRKKTPRRRNPKIRCWPEANNNHTGRPIESRTPVLFSGSVAFENIHRDQLADRGGGSFYRKVEIQPISRARQRNEAITVALGVAHMHPPTYAIDIP